MVRICSDCQVELRQVETNFLEIGQVWEAGFAPVALEAWACPRCGQVSFYAASAEALFSQRASEVVPLTIKEAYGEVLPVALEWHESVQLCAVYSGDDEDAYVDKDGLCPTWSFTFRDPAEQYLDLVLIGRIVERSPYEFDGESGAPFVLEELMDSPEIIARARRAGLQGESFTLAIERDEGGTLRAVVVGEDDQQAQFNPLAEAPG